MPLFIQIANDLNCEQSISVEISLPISAVSFGS